MHIPRGKLSSRFPSRFSPGTLRALIVDFLFKLQHRLRARLPLHPHITWSTITDHFTLGRNTGGVLHYPCNRRIGALHLDRGDLATEVQTARASGTAACALSAGVRAARLATAARSRRAVLWRSCSTKRHRERCPIAARGLPRVHRGQAQLPRGAAPPNARKMPPAREPSMCNVLCRPLRSAPPQHA